MIQRLQVHMITKRIKAHIIKVSNPMPKNPWTLEPTIGKERKAIAGAVHYVLPKTKYVR